MERARLQGHPELTYAELLASDDPMAAGLEFFRERFEALAPPG